MHGRIERWGARHNWLIVSMSMRRHMWGLGAHLRISSFTESRRVYLTIIDGALFRNVPCEADSKFRSQTLITVTLRPCSVHYIALWAIFRHLLFMMLVSGESITLTLSTAQNDQNIALYNRLCNVPSHSTAFFLIGSSPVHTRILLLWPARSIVLNYIWEFSCLAICVVTCILGECWICGRGCNFVSGRLCLPAFFPCSFFMNLQAVTASDWST